jgi:NAD-dependent oxidoreductase involved in siderophore biosynthesis
VTLSNGVPIETVSKLLGHSSLKTIQIYAKVLDTKISEDMEVQCISLRIIIIGGTGAGKQNSHHQELLHLSIHVIYKHFVIRIYPEYNLCFR